MLAAEHLLDFATFNKVGELLDALGKLRSDIFALPGPVDEDAEIVGFSGERRDELDFFLDAAAALKGFLRFDLVAPEIRGGCARFYL